MRFYRSFNIVVRDTIDVRSKESRAFLAALQSAVSSLSDVGQDKEGTSITLFEQASERRRLREVTLAKGGLLSAVTQGVAPAQERRNFTAAVATAAEQHLGVQFLDVKLVELRHVFQIKFKGNHHELIANALWSGSPVGRLATLPGTTPSRAEFGLNEIPTGRYDVEFALSVDPQTAADEIRSGQFDDDEIGVHCGIARIRGFTHSRFTEILAELDDMWSSVYENRVEELILQPLRQGLQRPSPGSETPERGGGTGA